MGTWNVNVLEAVRGLVSKMNLVTCIASVLSSFLLFSLISVLVPFSGTSIVGWLARTHGIADILIYFISFYFASIYLFILPSVILILLFGITLFAASLPLGMGLTLRDAEHLVLKSYFPFLLLFWIPVASWIALIVAAVHLIRGLGKDARKSILAFIMGFFLLVLSLSAAFLPIYLSANYELATPVRNGTLYLVGYTDDGRCGVHGVLHEYEIIYDEKLVESLEIYQPISFYETMPVPEVVLFSYLNMQTINGYLVPSRFSGSLPPRFSDEDNPPEMLYHIGYLMGNETCVLFLPIWKEQYFAYHHGDITPVMLCWMDGQPSMLLLSARSKADKLTLLMKGLSNLKNGLPADTLATPFIHGLRIFQGGEERIVMKYINPVEYVKFDVEIPARILVATPWHTFEPYAGDVPAVKVEPVPIRLTAENLTVLGKKYPDLDISYDITDPFAEPYVYINYPHVNPVWPEKVNLTWVEENGCLFLSPLWAG